MEVLDLKLLNYRNFANVNITFDPSGVLLYGKNGVGKTNILEAISFFAFGKSIKLNKDNELINFSKAFFRLEANFKLKSSKHFFEAAAYKNKKILKMDNEKISKISDLFKYIKTIYFSPEDINIISSAPSFRRKFLDIALSQYSFKYMETLRNYHRILKQRNALLKTEFSREEKKAWDQQLIEFTAKIEQQRLNYLSKFTPILTKYYNNVTGESEKLQLKYKYSFPTNGRQIDTDFTEHLAKIELQEIELQRTLAGPHLSDLDFSINGYSSRKYGSQGQMRSIAIAAKLVQAELISQNKEDLPILMFDDVLADLDEIRSARILDMFSDKHQIFIATPNKKIYERFNLPEIDVEKLTDSWN